MQALLSKSVSSILRSFATNTFLSSPLGVSEAKTGAARFPTSQATSVTCFPISLFSSVSSLSFSAASLVLWVSNSTKNVTLTTGPFLLEAFRIPTTFPFLIPSARHIKFLIIASLVSASAPCNTKVFASRSLHRFFFFFFFKSGWSTCSTSLATASSSTCSALRLPMVTSSTSELRESANQLFPTISIGYYNLNLSNSTLETKKLDASIPSSPTNFPLVTLFLIK
mmetsp:Transcript_34048/g.54476  ORF Transcript_34048/g.54476 Transcript_34048/m.54476 type:complete len:225 (-) Transcript_34048:150-824(-)